jgi:hypothetical protein
MVKGAAGTKRGGVAIVAVVLAVALAGCPSLADIGVGGEDSEAGDAGGKDARADSSLDGPDGALDGGHDVQACTSDAATDPHNCGACGHDCGGGACEGGRCQAYAIVTGNDGPYGIAVNKGIVYFTSIDDTVEQCTGDDCMNTLTQMTSGQQFPRKITTDTTNAYWTNEGFTEEGGMSGGIATCGLSGCAGGVATILWTDEFGPTDLAVDSTSIYWTVGFTGLVHSCPTGGCGSAPKNLASVATPTSGAAVDATSFYFTEPKLGNIIKCPLSGCGDAPLPFASGQGTPMEVDVTQGVLYWSNGTAIMSCPTSDCTGAATTFAANQTAAQPLAHDETNLYWALTTSSGKILSCPLSTGGATCTSVTVLADGQGNPAAIAVDDTAIYWTNSVAGTVMRLVK